MRCRPAIALVENAHLLLMRYRYPGGDLYNLPGGNLEPGEFIHQALIRECQEELGIEVELGKLLVMGEMQADAHRKACLHLVFEARLIAGIPILNTQESTADSLCWVPIASLGEYPMYPALAQPLCDALLTGSHGHSVGPFTQAWM